MTEIHPNLLRAGDRIGYKMIAVIGHNNDWIVYQGPSSWTDYRVIKHGYVVDQRIAKLLFPMITSAEPKRFYPLGG